MKRVMVYLVALSVLLTAMLSGCGENLTRQPAKTTPTPTVRPQESMVPETMLPDESDGIVTDTDGIITDEDNAATKEEKTDKTPDVKPEMTDKSAKAADKEQ